MNIKRFMLSSKIVSIVLKIISILLICGFVSVLILLLLGENKVITIKKGTEIVNFLLRRGTVPKELAGSIQAWLSLPILLVYSYIFYLGSKFFARLANGLTPFLEDNYLSLKRIGIILIITNLFLPIVYSILITICMTNGYYVSFGINTEMIIGIIIYCMGEILMYGVTLQELSDDTV